MKLRSNQPMGLFRLAFSLILCISVISCRKTDLTLKDDQNIIPGGEALQSLYAPAKQVQRVMNEFMKRGGPGFMSAFASTYGEPLWEKSIAIPVNSSGARDTLFFQADTLVLIPLFNPDVKEIQAYIQAILTDTVQLSVHTDAEYADTRFSNTQNFINEAERSAMRFMILNRLVFDYRTFQILDKRLFNGTSDYGDTATKSRKVKLSDNSNALQYIEVCIDVITTSYHCPFDVCTGPNGTCDECTEHCVTINTVTICQGWWDDSGGGGGGGGGDGGGGSVGGDGGGGDPCDGSGKIHGRELPCDGDGDDDGWDPDPEEDQPEDPCVTILPMAAAVTNLSQSANCLSAKSSILYAASDGNEHAVTFGRDANGAITTSSMSTGTPTSSTVDPNWPGGFADLHNHTNNTPPSAGDMYNLIGINNNHHGYKIRMVVTPDGSVYAYVITSLAIANVFVSNHPSQQQPGFPPDFPDPVFTDFDDARAVLQLQGFTQVIAEEMAMAYVLDKYHMGVALLKQDASGNFKRLRTQANGTGSSTTYTSNNCQ